MTETKETSLAEVIREAAAGQTGPAIVQIIPADEIIVNGANFYEMSDLEELAGSIELVGLLNPVNVKPADGGRYTLIDGERRYRAMTQILGWTGIPALVRTPVDEVVEELMLIEANRTQRRMTSAELSKQAERYTELLSRLKDSGIQIPGRLRDRVAEALQVSSTKLARLHAIRANLVPELLTVFDGGEINESKAYEISQTPAEFQQTLVSRPSWYLRELNIGIARDGWERDRQRAAEAPVSVSDTPDTGCRIEWDAEVYLSQRRQEDDDFYTMLGLEADHFLAELAYVPSRQDGIRKLKERFGSVHQCWWYDEVNVNASPKGLELGCCDRAIPYILRTWTDVYDMLARIALTQAAKSAPVSESNTAPAGLVWHDTEKEGPPPAGTRSVICWGDAGLYKPVPHLMEQEFDTFPENCRWWATVDGPEEDDNET